MGDRHRWLMLSATDAKTAQDLRKKKRPLNHSKPCPGTNPRSAGKWQKRIPQAGLAIFGVPPAGIKSIGIVPQSLVVMQMPGA